MSETDYLHGLIAADGSRNPDGRYKIELQSQDRPVLEHFGKVYDCKTRPSSMVYIRGLASDLKTVVPAVEHPADYARGLIDGDGCLTIRKADATHSDRLESIVFCYSFDQMHLVDWYCDFLRSNGFTFTQTVQKARGRQKTDIGKVNVYRGAPLLAEMLYFGAKVAIPRKAARACVG